MSSQLTLAAVADAATLYAKNSTWSLSNQGVYSVPNSRIEWTQKATKTPILNSDRTLSVNFVTGFVNGTQDEYDLTEVKVYIIVGNIIQYVAIESRTQTDYDMKVTDTDYVDVFRVQFSAGDPTLIPASSQKTFLTSANFTVPFNFASSFTSRIVLTTINKSTQQTSDVSYAQLYQSLAPVSTNEVVNIQTDATQITGLFKDFNTTVGANDSIGVNGTETLSETTTRMSSAVPLTNGTYSNTIALFTSNDIVSIDFPIDLTDPNSITQRYQFANIPDFNVQVDSIVNLGNGTSSQLIKYSAVGLASDEGGSLTTAWTNIYAPLGGLTISGSNGLNLVFTEQDPVASNLKQYYGIPGQQVTDTSDDPDQTEANAALAALLWFTITVDSNDLGDTIFNAEETILDLPPESPAGLQATLRSFNGLKYSEILTALNEITLSSLPKTEDDSTLRTQESLNDLFINIGGVPSFIAAIFKKRSPGAL